MDSTTNTLTEAYTIDSAANTSIEAYSMDSAANISTEPYSIDSIANTLAKAYSIIEEGGQPLAPETICIQYIFLSPSHIEAFHNNELYLEYIQNLVKERFNVSFPEEKSAFDQYFSDCIQLKEQLESHGNFDKTVWLSYTTSLLESLKTPYYSVYSFTLLTLESCFTDAQLFDKVQKAFYSVIIKSSEKKQSIIRKIIEHAPVYKKYPSIKENLLADILINTLALFGDEKEYWLASFTNLFENTNAAHSLPKNTNSRKWNTASLLTTFFEWEELFLKGGALKEFSSFSEYLSVRTLYFYKHTRTVSDNLLKNVASNTSGTSKENSDPIDSAILSNIENAYVDSEFLNTFAYNMTARLYHANPAIGREQEIADLELILISPKKSPLLIGEAGVGKTSIVEGLAYRLQRGTVPDLLKNKKIFKLTTTSLLSGTKYVGEMEDRIKKLAGELEAHPDVILFIDEIHTIVGAGSTESSNNDISNMLKPYIDRGDIKIIGATTREEYSHFLLPDKALARRFYPISVDEPDEKLTLSILSGSIPSIEYETKVKNTFSADTTEQILRTLISISAPENQPDSQPTKRPELPLTLLEMAFSYAALSGKNALSYEDIEQAVRHSNRLRKEIRTNFTCIL